MRRSIYEYKQERHTIQESEPWNYPSYKDYHVPPPKINNKMFHEHSFDHHYEPSEDHYENHKWYDHEYHENHDMDEHVKRNEHHAVGGRTILRPPLGSANRMSHHQTTYDDDGHGMGPYDSKGRRTHHAWGDYDYVKRNEHHAMESKKILRPPQNSVGSSRHQPHHQPKYSHGEYGEVHEGFDSEFNPPRSLPKIHNNSNYHGVEGGRKYGEGHREEDYYVGALKGGVESLIKGLQGLPNGGVVKKIEVIEYERRVYSGSTGHYEWKVVGGNGSRVKGF